ncbi:TatD family hydrolase [Gammaproteobacteria bacterium]|nr:TatD family hydrolase [Gammaproteobacteria bacterium]
MKYLIDSHCHIHHIPYAKMGLTLDAFIKAQFANEYALADLMCVCIELNDIDKLLEIQALHPQIKISLGQHPNDTHMDQLDAFMHQSNHLLTQHVISAIGETGLDYFRENSCKKTQRAFFEAHIQLAKQHKLPLIIHTRQARDDTMSLLKSHALPQRGVLHCFTESWDMAKKAIDLGFFISFSGIITFKNAMEIREVVKKTPMDHLLIETDAPYLAPVPYRGKPNIPAHVFWVAKMVSELKDVSIETVLEITYQNYHGLFK